MPRLHTTALSVATRAEFEGSLHLIHETLQMLPQWPVLVPNGLVHAIGRAWLFLCHRQAPALFELLLVFLLEIIVLELTLKFKDGANEVAVCFRFCDKAKSIAGHIPTTTTR